MRAKQYMGAAAAIAACISFTACASSSEQGATSAGPNNEGYFELPLELTSVTAETRNEACRTLLGSPEDALENMGMDLDELPPGDFQWDAEFLPHGEDVTLRCWTTETSEVFDGRLGIWMATGDSLPQVDNEKQGTMDESRQVGAIVNFVGENDFEKFISASEMKEYIDTYVIDDIER